MNNRVDFIGTALTKGVGDKKAYDGHKELAMHIVYQAVRDYQKALCLLHILPTDRNAKGEKRACESFFNSGYYKILCNIDGQAIMEGAQKQCKAYDWDYDRIGLEVGKRMNNAPV